MNENINEKCSILSGEYHLIGSSAMNYEMSLTFNDELLFITILTAASIFVVVLITFRSLAVPVILVLLVLLVGIPLMIVLICVKSAKKRRAKKAAQAEADNKK